MEKKLTYTEFGSSKLNEKNIIVIEIGNHYTRCGFAGEYSPRAIIKSCIKRDGNKDDVYLHEIENVELLKNELSQYIQKIYFNHLAVSPKDKKVVIVESVFSKSIFRSVLTKIILEDLGSTSILFVPDHLMALVTLGLSSGVVVNLGAKEVTSIAVVEGVTLLDVTQFANLGAEVLDSIVKKELMKVNSDITLTKSCVEDIRVRACFVAPYERSKVIQKRKHKKSLEKQLETLEINEKDSKISHFFVDDGDDASPASLKYFLENKGYIVIPGAVRETSCELFFDIYGCELSLPTLIIKTILSAPIDCRKLLCENIFIIGGLANMPGLKHRLSEELRSAMDIFGKKTPSEFKFHKSICPENYVSWLGASIFCTPSSTDFRSTTREQWIRNDKRDLNDWSDLLR